MNNKIKVLFSFLFLLFITIVKSQSNDTIFIKKDSYQSIYIINNKKSELYNSLVNYTDFNVNRNKQKIKSIKLNSKWLPLYKYEGKYYLYTPCDEINNITYVIDDSNIQIKSSEVTDFSISSIKRKKENIIIKYREPNFKSETILTIKPINKKNGIYKFITRKKNFKYEFMMLEANQYKNYDIIVNNCINSKVSEFKFDK
jgi:hypothetical protein